VEYRTTRKEVPIMVDPSDDADMIRIPRPRSLLRMLVDLLKIRSGRMQAGERGATITEVVRVLSESGRGGHVVSDGDRWSVTLDGPVQVPGVEDDAEWPSRRPCGAPRSGA
jgi:hypothetical protein